jgi:hypothetical protein
MMMMKGVSQTSKNGSSQCQTIMMPRESTPGKGGFSSTKQSKNVQQPLAGNILNNEERKMLFNTFMKEMNQSLLI